MAVLCPNCAREFEDNQVPEFCPTCGAKVEAPESYYTGSDFEEGPVPGYSFYCPMEDSQRSFFDRFMETCKQMVTAPSDFYRRMPPSGGLGWAILFTAILGLVGAIFTSSYNAVIQIVFPDAYNQFFSDVFGIPASQFGQTSVPAIIAGTAMGILFAPAGAVIGVLLYSLIVHGVLALMGGATAGLEATIKAYSYAQVSALGQVLPICGAYFLSPIWALVLFIIGVTEVHQCSTAKAVLAVLLPMAVCCGCTLLFAGMLIAAIAGNL